MSIETMERKAADNKYLHREFHNFFNMGLMYTKDNYGVEGVKEYLEIFTKNFYSVLIDNIKKNGLQPLYDHIKGIYEIEEASDDLTIELSDNKLEFYVKKCPAVTFIRETNRPVSDLYELSSTVVFDTIAKMSGLDYKCLLYNEQTGEARHVFTKGA